MKSIHNLLHQVWEEVENGMCGSEKLNTLNVCMQLFTNNLDSVATKVLLHHV